MKTRASDYWQTVRDKAHDLGTDGCTMATSALRDCCFRHDIEVRTGRSAVSGRELTDAEIDRRFLACMQARAILGWWSPFAWLRYFAVRFIGRRFLKTQRDELQAFDRTLAEIQRKRKGTR